MGSGKPLCPFVRVLLGESKEIIFLPQNSSGHVELMLNKNERCAKVLAPLLMTWTCSKRLPTCLPKPRARNILQYRFTVRTSYSKPSFSSPMYWPSRSRLAGILRKRCFAYNYPIFGWYKRRQTNNIATLRHRSSISLTSAPLLTLIHESSHIQAFTGFSYLVSITAWPLGTINTKLEQQ